MASCLDVCRGMLRVILVIVNAVVAVLGLMVLVVGIWAEVSGDVYFEIASDETEITTLPVLLIVVGCFVLLLGVVGVIGAVCAGTIGGRIILGLYGFVLALVIICEIAGGIAAGVLRGKLSSSFEDSASATFDQYLTDPSIANAWNTAQEKLKCCGNNNYTDYRTLFKNNSVPQSCCNTSALSDQGGVSCTSAANNTVEYSAYVYNQGCTPKVEDFFTHYLGVIAGVSIFFGILQIVGVVISCFVAIAKKPKGNYEVV